jgi:uncharacterized membrane protein
MKKILKIIMYMKALLIFRRLFVCNAYKNTVPASQRTQSVFITNTNKLILFREVISNICENYMTYIYTEFVNGTLDLKLLPR